MPVACQRTSKGWLLSLQRAPGTNAQRWLEDTPRHDSDLMRLYGGGVLLVLCRRHKPVARVDQDRLRV